MRRGDRVTARLILGVRRPRDRFRVMGTEVAGEIDQVGSAVTRLRVGDRVFGFAGFGAGTYAQFCCMSARGSLALIPTDLAYEEAASLVDGPTTALYFLRDRADVQRGDPVLILGASGEHRNRGRADRAALRRRGDRRLQWSEPGARDLARRPTRDRLHERRLHRGRYLVTVGSLVGLYLRDAWSRLFGAQKLVFGMSVEKRESLRFVRELVERGELRPVIDRRYSSLGHRRGPPLRGHRSQEGQRGHPGAHG